MKDRMLHPVLQKLAALVLLGVGLGAGISALTYPLIEARAERESAEARMARYASLAEAPPAARAAYDPADLAAGHLDAAEAQLALQGVVDRLARGAGIAVQSLQPLAAEHLGGIGQGVWVELDFMADLEALTAFLASFDTERPIVLVRRLEVERGNGPRPDVFMRVKAHIGRAWRPSETAS